LGETPYDPLREEKDEDVTKESSTDKKLSMLNETLIHFFRESGNRNGASVSSFGSASRCQLCCRNPSFGLATKAKGVARLRAKRKPGSHITYSQEC
jgi:hypothetical protein